MKLYRPVNLAELSLIKKSNWKSFPPRLPQQPIFYPVLDLDYANEINKWNIDYYGMGFVVEFEIDDDYISQFDVHNVGKRNHDEYWIPAEELDNFNSKIIGRIIRLDQK